MRALFTAVPALLLATWFVITIPVQRTTAQDSAGRDEGGKTAMMTTRDDAAAEKLGWRLAIQCWTFRRMTLFETIDTAASLGIRYLEIYPGQKLSKERPTPVGHTMDAANREALREKLAAAHVHLLAYGVVGLSAGEAESRKVFDFAKEMGIVQITSEPPAEAFDTVDKLVKEYDIEVAIHNHPKPSRYWDPARVLEVIAGRDERIGFCADTGHWVRSGIDPVGALEESAGRIIGFHLKELNEFGNPSAHDVPWGTGNAKMRAIMAEMKRQGFRGVCSIEYERDTPELVDNVRRCIAYFDKTAAELAR
jgi:sugar phosphate isomerase/epimerase